MCLHLKKILRACGLDAKVGSTTLQGSRADINYKDSLEGSKSVFKEADEIMIKFEGTTFKEKETISALLDTLSRSQATYYAHQLISYRIQIPDTTPSSSFGRQ